MNYERRQRLTKLTNGTTLENIVDKASRINIDQFFVVNGESVGHNFKGKSISSIRQNYITPNIILVTPKQYNLILDIVSYGSFKIDKMNGQNCATANICGIEDMVPIKDFKARNIGTVFASLGIPLKLITASRIYSYGNFLCETVPDKQLYKQSIDLEQEIASSDNNKTVILVNKCVPASADEREAIIGTYAIDLGRVTVTNPLLVDVLSSFDEITMACVKKRMECAAESSLYAMIPQLAAQKSSKV